MLTTKEGRPAIRTLRGWAIAALSEAHAIQECEEQPSGGVACTMTLRLSEFRVSVERSCRSTRANCTCDLRERHRIIITQIIIAHSLGVSKRRVARTKSPGAKAP